jgi:hypothetical protein
MRLQRAARAIAALVLTLTLGLATRAVAEETEPVSPDADFTVREITSALFKAKPGERLDYSNHDLTYLDLAGLNFKGIGCRSHRRDNLPPDRLFRSYKRPRRCATLYRRKPYRGPCDGRSFRC